MAQTLDELIRERAYHIWNASGGAHGQHDQFWLQAEREVLAELAENAAASVSAITAEPVAVETVAVEPIAVEPIAVEPIAAEPVAKVEPVAKAAKATGKAPKAPKKASRLAAKAKAAAAKRTDDTKTAKPAAGTHATVTPISLVTAKPARIEIPAEQPAKVRLRAVR